MLRWAILGTGFISNTVIDAIRLSEGSRVELIAGRNPDNVAEFQRRHSIPRSASYEEAVNDPAIDVVYIGLPNDQHHPLAIASSAAGKAVLSEKSLTTTMESAHALVDAVETNDTFFVEGLMYLAHPIIARFDELLRDGRLGALRSVTGRYGANIAHLVNPTGRGTIYNLGCYPVSLMHLVAQTMLGDDALADSEITAVGRRNPRDGTVCDAALAVRFGSAALATIQSSDNYGNSSEFAVAGDGGVLRFVTNPWLPVAGNNILRWEPHDGPAEDMVVTTEHDAFFHQVTLVERHLRRGDTHVDRPSPRPSDSLAIMTLLTKWEALCLASEDV